MLNVVRLTFVVGLAIDIVGALVLAQGFIVKRLPALTFEGTSGWGSPPNIRYIASAIAQKADAQVGFAALALGFVIQAGDYLFGQQNAAPTIPWWLAVLIAAMAAGAAYGATIPIRRGLVRRFGLQMVAHVVMRNQSREPRWIRFVVAQLAPRQAPHVDESDSTFVARIENLAERAYGITPRAGHDANGTPGEGPLP